MNTKIKEEIFQEYSARKQEKTIAPRSPPKELSIFSRIHQVLLAVLFTIVFTQQTLILKIQFKPSAFTGGVMRGKILMGAVAIFSFIGNMGLGVCKGRLNAKMNRTLGRAYTAVAIHQLLFMSVVLGIYSQAHTLELQVVKFLLPLLSSLSLGTIMLAASDSLVDSLASQLIGASSFAAAQLWGQKVFGKFFFSLLADNYNLTSSRNISCILILSCSLVVAIYGYLFCFWDPVVNTSPIAKRRTKTRRCRNYLIFPPLFLMLCEAFFLDTITSSARYIFRELKSSCTNESLLSDSYITAAEILTAVVVLICFKVFCSERTTFLQQWKNWSTIHGISFLLRLIILTAAVLVIPISRHTTIPTDNVTYVVKIREWELLPNGTSTKLDVYYSTVVEKDNRVVLIALGIFILNAAIDIISGGVLIILLKTFADNSKTTTEKFSYAEIDGLLRVFTYLPAAIPWIKTSPSLSLFASSAGLLDIQTTLGIGGSVYLFLSIWNKLTLRRKRRKQR